ncbi:hypothetical protein HK097_002104 [Rhizophlyctis rosea]|uniref:Uncharacterized protein n=1 Tax=Rhizophlyctis rosea TaxID=64517 RepID=A0AAD5X476_9FUNG|nr:hypothetical protein HK097_002104 [Rhizophlyctis rosea]
MDIQLVMNRCMWNADKRQRISASTSCGDSISAGSFHFGGEVFAYGASAGGEDGVRYMPFLCEMINLMIAFAQNMAEKKETKIFLHLVREGDVRV